MSPSTIFPANPLVVGSIPALAATLFPGTCRTRAPFRTLSWFATRSGAMSTFKVGRMTWQR
uniref:Uncharacterized protein n=1 Tax=Rhizophora mucronata TaxID=61149 RepID=A0A2P2MQX1_RHIMU